MKAIIKIIFLCGIIVLTAFSCEKEKPETIAFLVELVNNNNVMIDSFEKDDSVFFNYYLTNNMGREVSYVRPKGEILNFLKVFKQNFEGEYEYIGKPSAFFSGLPIIKKIDDNETKLISSVLFIASAQFTSEFNWPEMNSGNYYVGDTLKLTINNERYHFESRLYFKIK